MIIAKCRPNSDIPTHVVLFCSVLWLLFSSSPSSSSSSSSVQASIHIAMACEKSGFDAQHFKSPYEMTVCGVRCTACGVQCWKTISGWKAESVRKPMMMTVAGCWYILFGTTSMRCVVVFFVVVVFIVGRTIL